MANTLQDMYNFDSAEYDKNISQSFADKTRNYQANIEAGRKNMLAEAEIPSQLSGYQLKNAQNEAGLARLPQEQEIAKTERDRTQRFQLLTEARRAIDDPTLDDQTRKALLGMAVDKLVSIQYPEPQGLGDIKAMPGANPAAVKAHFRQMLASGVPGMDALRDSLDRSLQSLSMTQEGVQKNVADIQKQTVANNAQMLPTRYQSESGSGSSDQTKPWKEANLETDREVKKKSNFVRNGMIANGIVITLDQLGNPVGNPTNAKGGPLDSNQLTAYARILKQASEQYDPEIQRKHSAALTLAPAQYKQTYGQPEPTAPQPAAQSGVVKWEIGPDGKPRQVGK